MPGGLEEENDGQNNSPLFPLDWNSLIFDEIPFSVGGSGAKLAPDPFFFSRKTLSFRVMKETAAATFRDDRLIQGVRRNCMLASGVQAGYFSLCGLLLRLRQLYKWEHGLMPWQEPEPEPVLGWIEAQERAWESLEGQTWEHLTLGGERYDPLAIGEINERLLPRGLAYGAGFSRAMVPTCFLAELSEVRREDNLTILVLDSELARDLEGTPALCQGNFIYVRRQALAYYLWERLTDPTRQNSRFLKVALRAYHKSLEDLLGQSRGRPENFAILLEDVLEAVIHHEIGEARETSLGHSFSALLELFPHTRIELWLRALKDALAEVNDWGRLAYLIRAKRLGALALMLAWQPALYPLILPELAPAFWELVRTGDWQVLEAARQTALARLRQTAYTVRELVASQKDTAPPATLQTALENRFLKPLGL